MFLDKAYYVENIDEITETYTKLKSFKDNSPELQNYVDDIIKDTIEINKADIEKNITSIDFEFARRILFIVDLITNYKLFVKNIFCDEKSFYHGCSDKGYEVLRKCLVAFTYIDTIAHNDTHPAYYLAEFINNRRQRNFDKFLK